MTDNEKRLISCIVSNLLTGNHLLGRPRSEEQINLMKEFGTAVKKAESDMPLTDREKELLKEAASDFYGGAEDMCEQLGIDKKVLKQIESSPQSSEELKEGSDIAKLLSTPRELCKTCYNWCTQEDVGEYDKPQCSEIFNWDCYWYMTRSSDTCSKHLEQ